MFEKTLKEMSSYVAKNHGLKCHHTVLDQIVGDYILSVSIKKK